jgi:energy-coupling factor transporter ATP-binding protein EcfA2
MNDVISQFSKTFSLTSADRLALSETVVRFLVITGPVGIGKTTHLRELVDSIYKFSPRLAAYMPQRGCLMNSVSICTSLRQHGVGTRGPGLAPRVKQYLPPSLSAKFSGSRMKLSPSTLSGGEKRLLSVAVTLAKADKIVFLDEPTASLSSSASRWARHAISLWLGEVSTRIAIVVTHEVDLRKSADFIVSFGDEGTQPSLQQGDSDWSASLENAPPLPESMGMAMVDLKNKTMTGWKMLGGVCHSVIASLSSVVLLAILAPLLASKIRGAVEFSSMYSIANFQKVGFHSIINPLTQTSLHYTTTLFLSVVIMMIIAWLSRLPVMKGRVAMWLVGIQCIPVVVLVGSLHNTFGANPHLDAVLVGCFIVVTTMAPLLTRSIQIIDDDTVRMFDRSLVNVNLYIALNHSRPEVCRQFVAVCVLSLVGTIVGEYLAPFSKGLGSEIVNHPLEAYRLSLVIVIVIGANIIHVLAYCSSSLLVPRDIWGELS